MNELKHYDNLSVQEIKANIKFAEDFIKDLEKNLRSFWHVKEIKRATKIKIQRWEQRIELCKQILKSRGQ